MRHGLLTPEKLDRGGVALKLSTYTYSCIRYKLDLKIPIEKSRLNRHNGIQDKRIHN